MTPELLAALASVFFGTIVLVLAASTLVARGAAARRRLHTLAGTMPGATSAAAPLMDTPDPKLRRLTRLMPKSPKEMYRLERRLARAGWYGPTRIAAYALAEYLLPLVAAAIVVGTLGFRRGWTVALLAAGAAYLIPAFVLLRAIANRKKLIGNGLADALDLLIVCVEAGLSLDQAIVKASEELMVSHPALAEELRTITTETRAGKPRLDAFRNFARRTGAEDVQSLVTMLVQTDRFGTSIAQALRTYADGLRTKRRQRAEERAAKLGVKLVFPLVFCLMPAMFVVTLGPAVVQIVRVFAQIANR